MTTTLRRLILFLALGLVAGCGSSGPIQPTPPPVPQRYATHVTVRHPDGSGAAAATVKVSSDILGAASCFNDLGSVECLVFGGSNAKKTGASVTITEDGYLGTPYRFLLDTQVNLADYTLIPAIAPLPAVPSRQELLSAQLTFQGLWLVCEDYPQGMPVFDVMYDVLSPPCRAAFRAMKHAAGDKVIAIAVSHAYLEPNIPAPISTGHDWSYDYPGLGTLIGEIVRDDLYVQLHMAGDGSSSAKMANGSWRYNDPVGWTYGPEWLSEQLGNILNAVATSNGQDDLRQYTRFVIGFDGVFYGWTPQQVQDFGALFRGQCPFCALGVEHDAGHIPLGEGGNDYLPGGRMKDYDFVLGEFDQDLNQDTTYQIVGRMVPNYVRPPEQSPNDDPNPPRYMRVPNARGPWAYNCFEWGLYPWVRNRIAAATLAIGRLRLQTMGCQIVG